MAGEKEGSQSRPNRAGGQTCNIWKCACDVNLKTLYLVTFHYILVVLCSSSLSERCCLIAPITKMQLLSSIIDLLWNLMWKNVIYRFFSAFMSFKLLNSSTRLPRKLLYSVWAGGEQQNSCLDQASQRVGSKLKSTNVMTPRHIASQNPWHYQPNLLRQITRQCQTHTENIMDSQYHDCSS